MRIKSIIKSFIKTRNIMGAIFFSFATLCGMVSLILSLLYIIGIDFDARPLCSELSPEQIKELSLDIWSQFNLGIGYILFAGGIISCLLLMGEFIRQNERGNFDVYGDTNGILTVDQQLKFLQISMLILASIFWTGFTYYFEATNHKNCSSDFTLDSLENLIIAIVALVLFYIFPTFILGTCATVFWMECLEFDSEKEEIY